MKEGEDGNEYRKENSMDNEVDKLKRSRIKKQYEWGKIEEEMMKEDRKNVKIKN